MDKFLTKVAPQCHSINLRTDAGLLQIPLSQGLHANVSIEDALLVCSMRWHAVKARTTFYAASRLHGKTVYMHRLLMGLLDAPGSTCVDHIDGDGLNNTRANLRTCTAAENSRKRRAKKDASRNRGVWRKGDKFVAQIGFEGKFRYLGIFDTEREAAFAYQKAAKELFGEFAP